MCIASYFNNQRPVDVVSRETTVTCYGIACDISQEAIVRSIFSCIARNNLEAFISFYCKHSLYTMIVMRESRTQMWILLQKKYSLCNGVHVNNDLTAHSNIRHIFDTLRQTRIDMQYTWRAQRSTPLCASISLTYRILAMSILA